MQDDNGYYQENNMPINFVGDKVSTEEAKNRVQTGYYSLDKAFEDNVHRIGWPLPSYVEVSGYKGVGKTSFCLAVSGILASKLRKRISVLDFEGQHLPTIEHICDNSGYSGDINLIYTHKDERTEDTLERTLDLFLEDNQDIVLLDSIGAFSPTAEMEGKIGDSNMGIKAREVGQLSKKAVHMMMNSESPTAFFATNHLHPNIGFPGSNTSGGTTKTYLAHLILRLKKVTAFDYDDLGWLLEGSVEKNRYGYTGRTFTVFLIGGEGMHHGLSSIFDCVMYDYAKIENGILSMEGQKFGRIKSIIKNRDHEKDVFIPFVNRLIRENIVVEDDTVSNEPESKEEPNLEPKKRGRKKK